MMRWSWNPWFFIPVLLFFAQAAWILYRLGYGEEILFWNDYREQPLNVFFKTATRLGEVSAYLLAVFSLLFYRYRYALLLSLTGLAVVPTINGMKNLAKVPRPISYFEQMDQRDNVVLVPGEPLNRGRTSFPSGHTAGAFALFTTLTLMLKTPYKPFGLLFAVGAITAGISRIFLVQHFLSDVLAGALLGMLIALMMWPLNAVLGRNEALNKHLFSV
ncbi:MAG: phosphatase PAP2 family protein [Saprospiraceae bacterium]